MTTIKSTKPKDFWEFFKKKIGEKDSVFLLPQMMGLTAKVAPDDKVPPGASEPDQVSKKSLITFLKVLVALRGRRPVKLIPSEQGEVWKVYYGPKP